MNGSDGLISFRNPKIDNSSDILNQSFMVVVQIKYRSRQFALGDHNKVTP
jgi:hypothetical protein